ncbi:hypothetical protein TW95_gp0454 [Pandoravirus inopinatum]|uniref:Uncharacterized protein n=1 Tax=Pandoravirus inopinatum TaxID=1605721 RepID=A0A0B5IWW7_9VIRU|nr:hypothetical protein TW95_gp0454 [Pandoravirus inopinatum]AJF97188.1 hypothetical protein [Pandoravirus inopinatum]
MPMGTAATLARQGPRTFFFVSFSGFFQKKRLTRRRPGLMKEKEQRKTTGTTCWATSALHMGPVRSFFVAGFFFCATRGTVEPNQSHTFFFKMSREIPYLLAFLLVCPRDQQFF